MWQLLVEVLAAFLLFPITREFLQKDGREENGIRTSIFKKYCLHFWQPTSELISMWWLMEQLLLKQNRTGWNLERLIVRKILSISLTSLFISSWFEMASLIPPVHFANFLVFFILFVLASAVLYYSSYHACLGNREQVFLASIPRENAYLVPPGGNLCQQSCC